MIHASAQYGKVPASVAAAVLCDFAGMPSAKSVRLVEGTIDSGEDPR
jgi:hypothetical protein